MSVLYLIVSFLLTIPGEDYRQIFEEHYDQAVHQLEQQEDYINERAEYFEVDDKITSAVVFPELIRYSIIRDILEANSLEIVYINTGKADFSIGPFQIKPSFAEKIEKIVAEKREFARFRDVLKYGSEFSVEKRKERVERLKSINFQIDYVLAFQLIVEKRFSYLKRKDQEYRVKFISTAYNYDFTATRKEIEKYMQLAYFPWGSHNHRKKYNYADISWFYYCRENNINSDFRP